MNYFIPAYNFTGDGEEINVAERKRFKHSGFTEPKFYTNEWYLNTYFKNLESRVEIEDDSNNFNEHRFNFNFFYFNYDNFSEFSSDQDTLNLDVKDFYWSSSGLDYNFDYIFKTYEVFNHNVFYNLNTFNFLNPFENIFFESQNSLICESFDEYFFTFIDTPNLEYSWYNKKIFFSYCGDNEEDLQDFCEDQGWDNKDEDDNNKDEHDNNKDEHDSKNLPSNNFGFDDKKVFVNLTGARPGILKNNSRRINALGDEGKEGENIDFNKIDSFFFDETSAIYMTHLSYFFKVTNIFNSNFKESFFLKRRNSKIFLRKAIRKRPENIKVKRLFRGRRSFLIYKYFISLHMKSYTKKNFSIFFKKFKISNRFVKKKKGFIKAFKSIIYLIGRVKEFFFPIDIMKIFVYTAESKDLNMLMKWFTRLFEKVHLKKHKLFFRVIKKLMRAHLWKILKHAGVTGFMLKIRGKIGAAGSVKRRMLFIKFGNFPYNSFKGRMVFKKGLIRTYTGVLGVSSILSF